jgi:polyisoprenoid-binding protein YceI
MSVTIRTRFVQHKIRNSIVLALAIVVVVVAFAAPFIYIHFIEGPPPAELSLSSGSSTTNPATSPRTSVGGTWNVGKGSIVGYRVSETLIGQASTAVGRTSKVWGSLDISGTTINKATFSADMASVVSDQAQRNSQFDGRIMDVAQYPTATFALTSPIKLTAVPEQGTVANYSATGNLTMHGVTKPITFSIAIEGTSSGMEALAEIPIQFSTWKIANPSIGGFVTTANSGTLEVLLSVTSGAGNKASSSGAPSSSGGGGPIKVPSTTIPGLKLPSN